MHCSLSPLVEIPCPFSALLVLHFNFSKSAVSNYIGVSFRRRCKERFMICSEGRVNDDSPASYVRPRMPQASRADCHHPPHSDRTAQLNVDFSHVSNRELASLEANILSATKRNLGWLDFSSDTSLNNPARPFVGKNR